MKKVVFLLFAFFLAFTWLQGVNVEAAEDVSEEKVELTEAQKEVLKNLHEEMYELKVEMIEKNIEFGVISKEKGEEILKKIKKHHEKMEEHGFQHKWDHKGKYHKCD
jgi:hypothetical protein